MSRTIEAVRVEAEESSQRPRPFFNPEALGAAAAELFRQPDLVLRQLDDVQQEMDGLRRLRSLADVLVPQHDWKVREIYPDGVIG